MLLVFLMAISLSMDAFSLALAYGTLGMSNKDKIILSFSLDNSNTPEKYSAILGYDTYLENLKGVIL